MNSSGFPPVIYLILGVRLSELTEIKEFISLRMIEVSEKKSEIGIYECCKKNMINELLDVELFIDKMLSQQEQTVAV